MNAQEFCNWLQGSAELHPGWVPSPEQWKSIKEHLQTVFVKVTPPMTPHVHIVDQSRASPARPKTLDDYLREHQVGVSPFPVLTC